MTNDLQTISEKLNLAVRRLQTFDRRAHEDAHRDIVEAAFWLSILLEQTPVSDRRAPVEAKP